MHINKITTLAIAVVLTSIVGLAGCAHWHPPIDGTVTKAAKARRTTSPPPAPANSDDAKVVLKSSGMPMAMVYWKSTAGQACEGFERIGSVFYSGRDVLLPWIAHMTERMNKAVGHTEISRTIYVKPGVTVQVKGTSGSEDCKVVHNVSWTSRILIVQLRPVSGSLAGR